MPDLSRSHGVDYTVVRNLTENDLTLMWFPAHKGHGRLLGAHDIVRFSGNLFETMLGVPKLHTLMLADIQSGKVAIQACGTDPHDYGLGTDAAVTISCDQLVYESSSSTWIIS